MFVSNKIEDVNLRVFIFTNEINKSKIPKKYISHEFICEFDGRKCNLRRKSNNDKCQYECLTL